VAGHGHQPSGLVEGINVTPLVDITLVLLIVTFVTAHVLETPAVPLDLPRATQSESVQVTFSIVVPRKGVALINGLPASDADIATRASAALRRSPNLRAVIQADGDVPHRRVVHIMDLLRGAGVSRVAFGALPEEEGRPGRNGR
jgi:biopolymer transport protein TolR